MFSLVLLPFFNVSYKILIGLPLQTYWSFVVTSKIIHIIFTYSLFPQFNSSPSIRYLSSPSRCPHPSFQDPTLRTHERTSQKGTQRRKNYEINSRTKFQNLLLFLGEKNLIRRKNYPKTALTCLLQVRAEYDRNNPS